MGGNSKGATAPTTSDPIVGTQPAYLKNTAPASVPAGMPGQLPALAQQLGIGFGVAPQSFMDFFKKTYSAPQTLNYNVPPQKPKPAAKPAPKPGATTSPLNVARPSDKFTYLGGRNAR